MLRQYFPKRTSVAVRQEHLDAVAPNSTHGSTMTVDASFERVELPFRRLSITAAITQARCRSIAFVSASLPSPARSATLDGVDVALLTTFLAPFLGAFLKAGQSAIGVAAERGGEQALEHARRLWDRLRGKVSERPEVAAAAEKVAARPGSSRRQRALSEQLELLLAEEPELAREVDALWAQAVDAGVVAVASGDRSAAVAGDVSSSVIVTGDNVSLDQ